MNETLASHLTTTWHQDSVYYVIFLLTVIARQGAYDGIHKSSGILISLLFSFVPQKQQTA